MRTRRMAPIVFALVAMLVAIMPVAAATTVVVTPANTQGWSTADTRTGGAVSFVADAMAPSGVGALRLTTNATTGAKAQYLHAANTPLAAVTELSYYTKQVSAPFPGAAASYQLPVLLNGTAGFTTLVFEPYQNPLRGPVVTNTWQQWDVDAGLFWSSETIVCSNGTITRARGGPATYTLAALKAACPNAVAVGFGVNIGSYNPSYDVRADLVSFNGMAYDFEPYIVVTDKDDCKNGGWQNVTTASGQPFTNQGDCVSYVATGGKK